MTARHARPTFLARANRYAARWYWPLAATTAVLLPAAVTAAANGVGDTWTPTASSTPTVRADDPGRRGGPMGPVATVFPTDLNAPHYEPEVVPEPTRSAPAGASQTPLPRRSPQTTPTAAPAPTTEAATLPTSTTPADTTTTAAATTTEEATAVPTPIEPVPTEVPVPDVPETDPPEAEEEAQ